jgi:hypothetical protein
MLISSQIYGTQISQLETEAKGQAVGLAAFHNSLSGAGEPRAAQHLKFKVQRHSFVKLWCVCIRGQCHASSTLDRKLAAPYRLMLARTARSQRCAWLDIMPDARIA